MCFDIEISIENIIPTISIPIRIKRNESINRIDVGKVYAVSIIIPVLVLIVISLTAISYIAIKFTQGQQLGFFSPLWTLDGILIPITILVEIELLKVLNLPQTKSMSLLDMFFLYFVILAIFLLIFSLILFYLNSFNVAFESAISSLELISIVLILSLTLFYGAKRGWILKGFLKE